MRILHVHNRYAGNRGGEDFVVDAEREILRGAGHEVATLDVTNPDRFPGAAGTLAAAPWNPVSARRASRAAEELEPDVVHVHNTWFALSPSVLRAFRRSGARVVMSFHNFRTTCVDGRFYRDGRVCTDCAGKGPWRGVLHRCYRDSAVASGASAAAIASSRLLRVYRRYVDVALASSDLLASHLVQAGVPEEIVEVKPNFVADPGTRGAAPGDSNRSLFIGRLSPEKGVEDLLTAWGAAPPPGQLLSVVGDGPLATSVRGRALDASIELAGWLERSAVDELLLASRAVVFPSRCLEVHPLTITEAFASGTPVLAANHGAAAELVEPLGPMWLYEPGDAGSLERALAVLEDPAEVNRAGQIARAEYDRSFTPALALARLEAAYSGA